MTKVSNFLTKEELAGINKAVEQAELLTSGEIKVVIRPQLPTSSSAKQQALNDFYEFGLDKTRDKTAVLILIVLSSGNIEVLGDKGINDKVPDGYWAGVVKIIADGFKNNKGADGICKAVVEVGNLLKDNFPRKPDDVNEISNEAVQE